MVSLGRYVSSCWSMSTPNFNSVLPMSLDPFLIGKNENSNDIPLLLKPSETSENIVLFKHHPHHFGNISNSYIESQVNVPTTTTTAHRAGLIAPLSSSSPGFARSQLSHGVRQVVLCKDGEGRVGLRVKSIDKGIFVCLVTKGSPASMGGLRFGDQILQINGQNVAGFSEHKVHDIFKRAGVNNIVLAVRDRPFERTLTLHKDSTGHLGFQFKEGKITSIAVDSSAARNGLLIDHNLLEVNGQNMVAVRDKEIGKVIDEAGQIVTITVIPTYLYQHMMKNMSGSLVKKLMDHSIPDF